MLFSFIPSVNHDVFRNSFRSIHKIEILANEALDSMFEMKESEKAHISWGQDFNWMNHWFKELQSIDRIEKTDCTVC